ncbi:hypothetical protein UFOVP43_6 [uncultured Caudovirales phage]|uniref:DUF7483 domain-containing protein n=1 Tax=uncultured Caudovirales phage TaxID=2100421 RepID=A0A6J5KQ16_9CAUD|nr:hypothetical protein UFOVP43_6 [uncultured Caudovirales phage]
MPLQQTSGNSTTDAYGGGVAVKAKYIEDFFVTWLRTGTGASATVTTGLNASANKALVWTKSRSAATDHKLTDTVRGATKALISDTTGAQTTDSTGLTAFSSTGYTVGADINYNNSGATYVDWEFVATPKFFDIVTYTGDGNGAVRKISHNLQGAVGAVFIKATSTTSDWFSAVGPVGGIYLNTTAAAAGLYSGTGPTNATGAFTSTTIDVTYVGDATTSPNVNGVTYVMYVFAHNAGGFGLTGTDNVISCGSYTGNGIAAGPLVTLGYEPQYVMIKNASNAGNWLIQDVMRGMPVAGSTQTLFANLSNAEASAGVARVQPTATGFQIANTASSDLNTTGDTYIYIAIRRGPMKVPTDGTKVFSPLARNTTGTNTVITTTLSTVDMVMYGDRSNFAGNNALVMDRLRGYKKFLQTRATGTEVTDSFAMTGFDVQKGYGLGDDSTGVGTNYNPGTAYPLVNWQFGRAPGFFDEVCYPGTGAIGTKSHNLTVVPELMIIKDRSVGFDNWNVYSSTIGPTGYLLLNTTSAKITAGAAGRWNNLAPTSTVINLGSDSDVNGNFSSGYTYVAYLFATCPGVSKVGSYTGNGTTQTINCGFAAGARFVLIKRTDSTGDWYVYDTARGMTTLTDPYLLLNSTAAEAATLGSVTTITTGFAVNASILAAINTNAATYIFLAIA